MFMTSSWLIFLKTLNIRTNKFFLTLFLFFFWSLSTFKRVNVVKWNFLTLPKYRKQKILTKFEFRFFNPTTSWRGGIKIEVIKKLVGDPMLLNMIFKANKNKKKSRRWVVYLKNWASYGDFRESSRTKSQFLKKIQISKSRSVFEIRLWIFACDLNIYRVPNSK